MIRWFMDAAVPLPIVFVGIFLGLAWGLSPKRVETQLQTQTETRVVHSVHHSGPAVTALPSPRTRKPVRKQHTSPSTNKQPDAGLAATETPDNAATEPENPKDKPAFDSHGAGYGYGF